MKTRFESRPQVYGRYGGEGFQIFLELSDFSRELANTFCLIISGLAYLGGNTLVTNAGSVSGTHFSAPTQVTVDG